MDISRRLQRGHTLNGTIRVNDHRPMERVWFASPSAKNKWHELVKLEQQKAARKEPKKKLMLIASKKRKIASIDSEEESTKKSKSLTDQLYQESIAFMADLGPIPSEGSTFFANMSFLICHVEESEEESKRKPFYSGARLDVQLKYGGGKVYESFKSIPPEEHSQTILITNTPSVHPQILLCSNAGIPVYSYQWVIKCCQQNEWLDPKKYEITPLTRELRETISSSKSKKRQNKFSVESPF